MHLAAAKWIILDRDGVINYDSVEFIKSPAEWQAIPGSLEAIAALNQAGYRVAVATNQSGIARGLYDSATLAAIHAKMQAELATLGGRLDYIAYCPHGPTDNCYCRKPLPGLLEEIAQAGQFSLAGVPCVGDSLRDLQAAQAVGAQAYLVLTGNGQKTLSQLPPQAVIPTYTDLATVVTNLLS